MGTSKKSRRDKSKKPARPSGAADVAPPSPNASGVKEDRADDPSGSGLAAGSPVTGRDQVEHRGARGASGQGRSSGAARPFGPGSFVIGIVVALTVGVYAGTLFNSPSVPGGSGGEAPAARQAPAPPAASAPQTAQILELEQAVLKNANDLAAWIQLGNLYFDTSKPREAIRAYERALAIKPDNADVLTDLGIMLRETGQYEQAVESFRKAIKIKPGHQNAMFNSGVVLFFDLGRKDEARKAWRDLLAVNPGAMAPDGQPVREMLEKLK